jgi:protein involved in polysaccharide export with SLBB domain
MKFGFSATSRALGARARAICVSIVSVAAAGVLSLSLAPPATAQNSSTTPLPPALQQLLPPGTTPQQIFQQLQQGQSNGSLQTPQSSQPSQQILITPQASSTAAASDETSHLETQYSARAGTPLHQFGYGLIANGGTVYSTLNGAIQDDYILGAGDQINATLQGQQNASYSVQVDRNGQVILPGLPPVPAGGRRFGDFRADLEAAIKRVFIQTRAFISIGQVRQISIRVVGDVENPGVYAATGLSTVLDALNLAGGIKKSGSLRNVALVRGGNSYRVDLYAMLSSSGKTPDMVLTQGDRIVVPAIGPTVAVAGEIRRPGIYELPPGRRGISEHELLALGGGPEIRGVYRQMVLRILPNGKQQFVDIGRSSGAIIEDGEVLFVNKAVNIEIGGVTLAGAVRVQGQFALNRARTLHDLLPSADVFAPTPYLLLGVIERTEPKSLQRALIPFSPVHVIQGTENRELITNDVVHILTLKEMQFLAAAAAPVNPHDVNAQANQSTTATNPNQPGGPMIFVPQGAPSQGTSMPGQTPGVLGPGMSPLAGNASAPGSSMALAGPGQVAMQGVASGAPVAGTQSAPAATSASAGTSAGAIVSGLSASDINDLTTLSAEDTAFFGHTLAEYRSTLNGAIRIPGVYLTAPGTTLAEAVAAAGGLDADVDLSSFEITSVTIDNASGTSTTHRQTYHLTPERFASIVLKPYDAVDFRDVYADRDDGQVTLDGQVRYPGTYNILRGERLSSVLARAGGLTEIAYPYGAVFTRPSVAAMEHQSFVYQADQMESQLASYLSSAQITPDAVSYLQALTARLRNAPTVGRIAIQADPAVLAVHPQLDIMLQPGDALVVPRHPADVAIAGEVLSPGSVVYRQGLSANDYIAMAGGVTQLANDSDTFIVYPDGSARPVNDGIWTFSSPKIIPGSTIVVPRDVTPPINWLTLAEDIGKITSELAITGASLAIIGKGN